MQKHGKIGNPDYRAKMRGGRIPQPSPRQQACLIVNVEATISETDEKGMETMALAKDPVCGMNVDPDVAHTRNSEYKNKTYYFCSPGCKEAFDKEPDKYASPSEAE